MITTKERGRGAHYICGSRCRFRRNTLITNGDNHIIVSTVGNMRFEGSKEPEPIGCERHYETFAYIGKLQGNYIDAVIANQLSFDSNRSLEFTESNKDNIDNLANEMHEKVVEEISGKFDDCYKNGVTPFGNLLN